MNLKISDHFTREEFMCKCGCGLCNVSSTLLSLLDSARNEADMPFTVTSGCRCLKHNKDVGGVSDSAHVTTNEQQCEAADIECDGSRDMFVIVSALIKVGFKRIGINFNKMFVHCDVDSEKPQDVLFHY
jgi:uncharacterized protein YcbK (DUF882 family)